MVWIKRNLIFVISIAVGLGLTGYCAYLLYNSLDANSGVSGDYQTTLASLEEIQKKEPFPSKENIEAAKKDQDRVRQFLAEFRKSFASFPAPPAMNDIKFKNYLEDSLVQFRAEATNAGVQLPPEFDFSFSGLIGRLNYTSGNISAWMVQLEEIKAILGILCRAKINYLSSLCRVPVSADDTGSADCFLQAATVTNQWGVVTPYKIIFRGFTTEIAAVMEGFARASNCFIIQSIDVAPDTSVQQMAVQMTPTAAPAMTAYAAPPPRTPYQNPYQNPYETPPGMGMGRGRPPGMGFRPPTPVPAAPAPVAAAPVAPAAPVIILSENPLLVTISVNVVKLKASEH